MSNPNAQIGRADYYDRQEEKEERRIERAAKLEAEAERLDQQANRLSDAMNGTPILIGHHSEKRHRRDIDRVWDWRRKAAANRREAERLRSHKPAHRSGVISSDAPDALEQIRAKIADCERLRDRDKALNAAWRKAGKPSFVDFQRREMTAEEAEALKVQVERFAELAKIKPAKAMRLASACCYSWDKPGNPSRYSTEIRRLRKREADLLKESERRATGGQDDRVFCREGLRVVASEDREDNRICLYFDAIPEEEDRKKLKACGWRWSRRAQRWQRMLTPSAWPHVSWIAESLGLAEEQC